MKEFLQSLTLSASTLHQSRATLMRTAMLLVLSVLIYSAAESASSPQNSGLQYLPIVGYETEAPNTLRFVSTTIAGLDAEDTENGILYAERQGSAEKSIRYIEGSYLAREFAASDLIFSFTVAEDITTVNNETPENVLFVYYLQRRFFEKDTTTEVFPTEFSIDSLRDYDQQKIARVSYFIDWNRDGSWQESDEYPLISEELRLNSSHSGGDIHLSYPYLYVTMGDGEPNPATIGDAQDMSRFSGSILKLKIDEAPTTETCSEFGNYATVFTNDDGCNEIVARGLRHPWRFDVFEDEFFIADTGYLRWEAVAAYDLSTESLANYGWPCYEGGERVDYFPASQQSFCEQTELTRAPVLTYPNERNIGGRCAIVGTIVTESYIYYSDYCEPYIYQYDKATGATEIYSTIDGITGVRALGRLSPTHAYLFTFVSETGSPGHSSANFDIKMYTITLE